MPEGAEVLATHVAFLELRDERRLIREGCELLDEKRVLPGIDASLRFMEERLDALDQQEAVRVRSAAAHP